MPPPIRYLFVPLLLLLAPAVRAAPIDPAVAARNAAIAAEEREAARVARDTDAALVSDSFRLAPFIKEDAVGLKAASEALAVAHERIAEALEHNDGEAAGKLRPAMDEAYRIRMLWRDRIATWRYKQFAAAPTEQWFNDYVRWYHQAMPEMLAFGEARKAAAEAWGRVAEASVPEGDPVAFEALKEQAYALDTEREVAEMRFTWARERELSLQDKKVSSPELTRRVEALKQVQEQRMAAKRLENEQARRVRELDRSIKLATDEAHKAFDAAQREALERAQRPKGK